MPMLSILCLLAAQSKVSPAMPLASSEWFQTVIRHIESLSTEGKFDEAGNLLNRLVDSEIKIKWNTADVPKELRPDLAAERDLVISDWKARIGAINPVYVESGADVEFRFTSAKDAKVTWETNGSFDSAPLLTFTIPLGPTLKNAQMHNDLSYSFGRYLGIDNLAFPGFVMNHSSVATDRMRPHSYEYAFGVQIYNFLDQLRLGIRAKTAIAPSTPRAEVLTKGLKSETVLQGSKATFKVDLKSIGDGPLTYLIIPDCSCFSTGGVGKLDSGKSVAAPVYMDTTEFGGVQSKKLYVVTNDSSKAVTEVPVEVPITERYRFIPDKGQVFILPKGGKVIETYLVFPDGKPLKLKESTLAGLTGKLEVTPWEGNLADPARGEAAIHRKGYRIRVDMPDLPISGRLGASVLFKTDDPIFGEFGYPMLFQQGIMASPLNLFLGEIGDSPREAIFLVTRPGEPFKLLGVESDSAHLSATIEPLSGGADYKVHVLYDGKAAKGSYGATLTLKTDDPDQPKILVPVSAQVK